MRTIAISNQKGGCGKTTTAVNLAAAVAQTGRRVLIVDLDPQGHATLGLGYNPDAMTKTIYNVIVGMQIPISEVVLRTKIETLDLVPANILLAGAEIELAGMVGRELILSAQLEVVQRRYDVCIIDCPPSVGMLTLNALVASTDVIIPVQVHYYAMEGLKQLFETANRIRERFHPCDVKILGLLLTFVESGTLLCRQIEEQMRDYFSDMVFNTVIHKTTRLAEAPSSGQSVLTYDPKGKGSAEYRALAQEISYVKV